VSKERAKGTSFETFVVNYLKQFYPLAERRTLHGSQDKGDIAGTDPRIVWECKNQKVLNFSTWLHEAQWEKDNAKAELGIVVAKRRSYGNPADQYAVLRLEDLLTLLKKAGY
jgi:ATP:corrinoid adenosyltransferase